MPEIAVLGKRKQYERGTSFLSIAEECQPQVKYPIALLTFNGKMMELSKKVEKDGVIRFITTAEEAGRNTYRRTVEMILIKAVKNITGDAENKVHVKIEFALNNSIFCIVKGGGVKVTEEFASRVSDEMRRIVDADLPIIKKSYPIDDAVELFRRQGMEDKVRLFHYRRSSSINVYRLEDFYDYFYGHMLPSTGMAGLFAVREYKGGLLLTLPTTNNPLELEPFVEEESLFEQLMLSNTWGELMELSAVADLNDRICSGNMKELIQIQEALMERRIGEIAAAINKRRKVKLVLIAGPSSSGKTTFANRLCIQLRSFGMKPHLISMDDYFVNREKTPVDPDGNFNFDVIEALDLDQFHEDMDLLFAGEKVDMPSFDFKLGKRCYNGNVMQLEDHDILVVEGIHGLNPKTSEGMDESRVFKVFISAMNSLNIDEHNRIPSTDIRLIRRMIRDARTRNYEAQHTITCWKKVRDAEDSYIYPYQDYADAVFNSSICYELAALKQFAEPLLFRIRKTEPEYHEAKRLLKFFSYFLGFDSAEIPTNSLCREFIGGGLLEKG